MIIAVDDDEIVLEVTQASLSEAGFAVKTFLSPEDALVFLEKTDPDLIVSDLMMPEMDGFAFRKAYLHAHPSRATPFLFLSSMSDPDIIVTGLELGADDYLVKPVDHRVFVAKVRSLLRKKTAAANIFHGDIAQFPLSKVMKFCELKGVSGSVEIAGDGVNVTLECRGGNFELDGQADSLQFEKAFDLTAGNFTIRALPVDYSDIHHLQVAAVTQTSAEQSQDLPMGKLSGVKINQRMFQVQSEFVVHPEQQVLTMVILDGKVVLKRGAPALLSQGRESLQQLIESQHDSVELEIREKISSHIEGRETNLKARFNALFEEGWESYCTGRYDAALTSWEEAQRINPADKTIETNLKIVRKKLASL